MKYMEVAFVVRPCTETACDLLAGMAGEIGFESFVENADGVNAYIPCALYKEEELKQLVAEFPMPDVSITWKAAEQEDKDWNEEWEKNFFQPIVIGDRCVIHSTFHKDVPQAEYDILIDPQMAFGTGHHSTTQLMVMRLLDTPMEGKHVLDMGCGTGILGILASMRGAKRVEGIDIDEWCIRNTEENIRLNRISNMAVGLGDATLLGTDSKEHIEAKEFDIVIANINRNVLVADMPAYAAVMNSGATLFLSGFYVEDIPVIREALERAGLTYVEYHEVNRWACVTAKK